MVSKKELTLAALNETIWKLSDCKAKDNCTMGLDNVLDEIVGYLKQDNLNFSFLTPMYLVICYILGILAALSNLTSMIAIWNAKNFGISINLTLMANLSLADLLISLMMIAHCTLVTLPNQEEYTVVGICFKVIIQGMVVAGLSSSLINLSALAMDHYIAIVQPFLHKKLKHGWRIRVLIPTCWIISFLIGFINFIVPPFAYHDTCLMITSDAPFSGKIGNVCQRANCSKMNVNIIIYCITIVCIVLMVTIYIRVFRQISHFYRDRRRMARYSVRQLSRRRQGLITTVLVLGTFACCWLPHLILGVVGIFLFEVTDVSAVSPVVVLIADRYLYLLLVINCLADSIIYGVRMKEVRNSYRRLIAKCIGRCSKVKCAKRNRRGVIHSTSQCPNLLDVRFNGRLIAFSTPMAQQRNRRRRIASAESKKNSVEREGGHACCDVFVHYQFPLIDETPSQSDKELKRSTSV